MNKRLLSFFLCSAAGLSGPVALAQATAPSQGGEVSLVGVTATTMELRFGTFGTGQGRIVIVAAMPSGTSAPLAAADGTIYTANAAFGQGSALGKGFVVYNGTGHSATVTGLQPGTRYYLANAEYNSDGTSIAYNMRGSSMLASTKAAPIVRPAPAPLPVELAAFSGTVDARGEALLHWATATEHNSAYFALERSTDGIAFAEAGRVAAAGNSSQLLNYQWPDPQHLAQPTYYRLRQADHDGAVSYSRVLTLAPAITLALASPAHLTQQLDVYPNPSAGQPVQFALRGYENETLSLRLADAMGRLVLARTVTPAAAHYRAALPLPAGLAAGTYVLTLAGTGWPVQKRLVIAD